MQNLFENMGILSMTSVANADLKALPKNACNFFLFIGTAIAKIALTFLGFGLIWPSEITKPKKSHSFTSNLYLINLI